MVARLPRRERTTAPLEKEREWLPRLAPLLPVPVTLPLANGRPAESYACEWSVYRWLEGEPATRERTPDLGRVAADLARFVAALRTVDPTGGPPPGEHNFHRGVPLAARDAETRAAIAALDGELDVGAATAAWEAALRAPAWQHAPVWLHGDLSPGNLLVDEDGLCGVADFGCLGVGDPACDLMIAWTLSSGESRDAYRRALAVDDASWWRGRGWALSWALIALPYYLRTNPAIAREARHTIAEVLEDFRAPAAGRLPS